MTTNAKLTVLPPCTNRVAFLGGVGGPPPIEDSSYKDETAAGVPRDAEEVRASEQKNTFTGRPETHTCILRVRFQSGGTGAQRSRRRVRKSQRTERSITSVWNRLLQQLSALSLSRHAKLCRHLEDEEQ